MTTFIEDFADLTDWESVIVSGTIAVTNGLCVSTGAGNYLHYNGTVTGTGQALETKCYSLGESSTHTVIMWARFVGAGGPPFTSFSAGYGLSLTWNADGTRTLAIVKAETSSTIVILASTTVTLESLNDTDLGVLQHLRLNVVDLEPQSQLPEALVLVRCYVNNEDDGNPDLEHVDMGRSTTGASPITASHRTAGTYALSFGAASDIQYDAFAGRDDFVLADYGYYGRQYHTLSELRTMVTRKISQNGITNYGSNGNETLNDAINDATDEVLRELGDKAEFRRRLDTYTLTADTTTHLTTMPHDVGRVFGIFTGTNQQPVEWRLISEDSLGRLQMLIEPWPSSTALVVDYWNRYSPMTLDTDYCAVPAQYDEAVRLGAILRLGAEDDRDIKYHALMEKRWSRALEQIHTDMSRIRAQRKQRVAAVPPKLGRGYSRLMRSHGFNC